MIPSTSRSMSRTPGTKYPRIRIYNTSHRNGLPPQAVARRKPRQERKAPEQPLPFRGLHSFCSVPAYPSVVIRRTAPGHPAIEFRKVDPLRSGVFDDNPPVDHHRVDIRSLAAVDQIRNHVVNRLQVGFSAGPRRSGPPAPLRAQHAQFAVGIPHGPGALAVALQHLPGRECRRVARGGFLQKGRRAQLLPHVQVVVREQVPSVATVTSAPALRSAPPEPRRSKSSCCSAGL